MHVPISRPLECEIHTLANGLVLIVDAQADSEVVSVHFCVESGSRHEGSLSGSGISHLLEHMLFKGTQKYDARQLADTVQKAGGQWNAYTSFTRTVYHIDGLATQLPCYLDVLGQMLFHARFDAAELAREKQVIEREMAMYDDDADSVLAENWRKLHLRRHADRHPIIGYPENFAALGVEQLQSYYRQRYTPNNMFIVVSGGVDVKQLLKYCKQHFAGIGCSDFVDVNLQDEAPCVLARSSVAYFKQPEAKSMLSWQFGSADARRMAALDALAIILGQGRSALLYESQHDDLGLVHDIMAYTQILAKDLGTLVIACDYDQNCQQQLFDSIEKQLQQLRGHDFSADLQRCVAQLESSRTRKLQSCSKRAALLLSNWHKWRNINADLEHLQLIAALQPAQLGCALSMLLDEFVRVDSHLLPQGKKISKAKAAEKPAALPPAVHTLPNGLRVIVDKRDCSGWVNVQLVARAGMHLENAQNAGLSSLYAELLLKGTVGKDSKQISRTLEQVGGYLESDSGYNSVSLEAAAAPQHLARILGLIGEIVTQPLFPAAALKVAKQESIASIKENATRPLQVALRGMKQAMYGEQAWGLSMDGSIESIKSIKCQHLLQAHQRIMQGDNMVLCVSGELSVEEVLALAAENFGSIARGSAVPLCAVRQIAAGHIRQHLDKQQAVLARAYSVEGFHSKYHAAMRLAVHWFGDMAGPLFSHIREQQGLAYYVSAMQYMLPEAGMLGFYLGCSPEQLEQAAAALQHTLSRLGEEPVQQETLLAVKNSYLSEELLNAQKPARRCASLALNLLHGLEVDFDRQIQQQISAMSCEEFNACLHWMLHKERSYLQVELDNKVVKH